MALTPEQTRLLSASLERLGPLPKDFGRQFYERLFELDPSLRELFGDDLERQASMFVSALTLAVFHLDADGRLARATLDLGRRHGDYGVRPEHYDVFGEALIWALRERLGEKFDDPTRDAWLAAYRLLASEMKSAADGSAAS